MPIVFIPRECQEGETRVAAVPETVQRLIRDGFEVHVERGAGTRSMISDASLEKAGAKPIAAGSSLRNRSLRAHPPKAPEAAGRAIETHRWEGRRRGCP